MNMPVCSFKFAISKPIDDLYNRAQAAASSFNADFTGTTKEGHFAVSIVGGSVRGSYLMDNRSLVINISKKPIFLPCKVIEEFVKGELKVI